MKFFNLIILTACLGLMTGCLSDDASVSSVKSKSIVEDAPLGTQPAVVDPSAEEEIPPVEEEEDAPILIDAEDSIEIESEDEVANDEETNDENENISSEDEVAVVDEPLTTPPEEEEPAEEEPPAAEEEPPVVIEPPEEEEEDEVVIIDEEEDQKCRKRGNLIRNGSFEDVDDRKGLRGISLDSIESKKWDVFRSLPSKNSDKESWYTSAGPGIEVQGDRTVAKTPHKQRVVELDSHGAKDTNSTMSQDVYLCRGRHILKFKYYPRTKSLNDNVIEVRINDKLIKSVDMVKDGKWYRIRAPFRVDQKGTYKISFSAAGKDNSLGALIDRVRLHKKIRRAGVVTSLLSLGDKDNIASPLIRREVAKAIISKTVNFASIKKNPKVLMLKDDFHNGESLNDFVLTESVLRELHGDANVSVISGEVRLSDVKDADVIYIINPGYPMGSAVTADTLREVKALGNIGIVISGDDMSRGRNFNISDLTGLKYKANGTRACGLRVDNNRDNKYSVKLRKRFFKKLSIESRVMPYGNDIDHTQIINKKVRVLADAIAPGNCGLKIPAIVGYKLKHKKISPRD